MLRILAGLVIVCAFASTVFAKRGPPPDIKPIEHDGVRYTVPNDEGRRAYVQAWDVKTDKKLWEADIFRTEIKPDLEEDVQWVFVKSMTLDNGKLKIVSEKNKTFLLDPKTQKVEEVK